MMKSRNGIVLREIPSYKIRIDKYYIMLTAITEREKLVVFFDVQETFLTTTLAIEI